MPHSIGPESKKSSPTSSKASGPFAPHCTTRKTSKKLSKSMCLSNSYFCHFTLSDGRYVLRILRTWRNWYVFSDDYLNGLQSTFLSPDPSDEEMEQQMKKLKGITEDDIERKCRFNGLSLRGGYRQQCMRYVRLEAYLHGTSNPTTAQKKSAKLSKPRKQQTLLPASKKETAKPKKMTETKTGGWVSVEQEKKPPVPISQWLQEKQQVISIEIISVDIVRRLSAGARKGAGEVSGSSKGRRRRHPKDPRRRCRFRYVRSR